MFDHGVALFSGRYTKQTQSLRMLRIFYDLLEVITLMRLADIRRALCGHTMFVVNFTNNRNLDIWLVHGRPAYRSITPRRN